MTQRRATTCQEHDASRWRRRKDGRIVCLECHRLTMAARRGSTTQYLGSPCTLDGCTQPVADGVRRVCLGHARVLSMYGTADPFRPTLDRFMSKVRPEGDCWQWTGRVHDGYGNFTNKLYGQRTARAHRVAWFLFRGELPDELVLDHLCRNKTCVNPWHLEPVTNEENVRRCKWSDEEHAARI